MDFDDMAGAAVDAVAAHLVQVGPEVAGRLGNHAIDNLFRLIEAHLNRSPQGAHAAVDLRHAPGSAASRQHARQIVAEQARHDPAFAQQLQATAASAGVQMNVQSSRTTYGGQAAYGSHNVNVQANNAQGGVYAAGRDVKIKKYHIGSIRFGTGGLVSGIALLIGVLGGGGAVVASVATGAAATLSSAVGTWTHAGSTIDSGGVTATEDPITLKITSTGAFTFTTAIHMNVGGQPLSEALDCSGKVAPSGDHLAFSVTGGPCSDFTGTVSGNTMTIGSFAQNAQSESLTRA